MNNPLRIDSPPADFVQAAEGIQTWWADTPCVTCGTRPNWRDGWLNPCHCGDRTARKRGQPISWANMQTTPPVQWQVRDLLPVAGVCLLVGHPKAGKSTLARVLAATLAGHGDATFLGREVVKAGRVLYCSPDEHPAMTVDHFRGILPADADTIDFLPEGGQLAAVLDHASGGRYDAVILDTLGRFLIAEGEGLETDRYMAWQATLDRVRRAATAGGCSVVGLHHARKSGGSRSLAVLGSAAIAGAADVVLTIEVNRDGDGWARYIESANRAGVDLPRQKLVLGGDNWLTVGPVPGPEATAPNRDSDGDRNEALRLYHDDGWSMRRIGRHLGRSHVTISSWLK